MKRFVGFLAFMVCSLPPLSQEPPSGAVPPEAGLYYSQGGKLIRVEGRAVSFARTGSLLSSAVTAGIKTRKINAQIPGRHAAPVVGPAPIFYYRVPSGGEAVGGSVGDLVLIRMAVKGNRRQFEMGAAGMGRMSTGISIRSQLDFNKSAVASGLYRAEPSDHLRPGQYAFYLFRGYDLPGFIYDFMVE